MPILFRGNRSGNEKMQALRRMAGKKQERDFNCVENNSGRIFVGRNPGSLRCLQQSAKNDRISENIIHEQKAYGNATIRRRDTKQPKKRMV